jgi:protein-disulfide isomerase
MNKDIVRLGAIAAGLIALLVVSAGFYLRSQERKQTEVVARQPSGDDSALVRPHSRSLGPKNAKVTVVEFLDPECESCRAIYPIVKLLLGKYSGQVRLVVRYMPFHGNAVLAASALEAAGEQGRYWEMLDTLFENQPRWGNHHQPRPELIPELAEQIGLDMGAFKRSLDSGAHRRVIEMDQADGRSLGVTATPTFFVNGKRLDSLGLEPLEQLIVQELAAR